MLPAVAPGVLACSNPTLVLWGDSVRTRWKWISWKAVLSGVAVGALCVGCRHEMLPCWLGGGPTAVQCEPPQSEPAPRYHHCDFVPLPIQPAFTPRTEPLMSPEAVPSPPGQPSAAGSPPGATPLPQESAARSPETNWMFVNRDALRPDSASDALRQASADGSTPRR